MFHVIVSTDENLVAFVVICAICFALWKWRVALVAIFSRGREQKDSEKGTASAGRWFKKSAKARRSQRRSLFGTTTTITGGGEHTTYNMPHPPPPALAPSTIGGIDMQARRQRVRHTLEAQREPGTARSQTFFIDDETDNNNNNNNNNSPAPRKTKRENLSLTIDVFGNATFVTPAVPDSPEAAKASSRYSWVTPPQDAQSLPRSSLESAPRFRTVNSWVSQQADRAARSGGNGFGRRGSGTTPPTPVEFRQHPGSPAEFLSDSPRIESRVLDLRIQARS